MPVEYNNPFFYFGAAGLNRAKLAELWHELLSFTGIVEQNVKYILWSGSQLAPLVKCEDKKFFLDSVYWVPYMGV